MLEKPVRQVIERMRKCGAHTIVCRNQTKIIIHELGNNRSNQPIGKFKWNEDGTIKVIRGFYCTIVSNPRTIWKEFPKDKKHWLYNPKSEWNYFHENDYYLSEKEMNGFISDNGDVDTYDTCSQYEYMMADMVTIQKEFEESMA